VYKKGQMSFIRQVLRYQRGYQKP